MCSKNGIVLTDIVTTTTCLLISYCSSGVSPNTNNINLQKITLALLFVSLTLHTTRNMIIWVQQLKKRITPSPNAEKVPKLKHGVVQFGILKIKKSKLVPVYKQAKTTSTRFASLPISLKENSPTLVKSKTPPARPNFWSADSVMVGERLQVFLGHYFVVFGGGEQPARRNQPCGRQRPLCRAVGRLLRLLSLDWGQLLIRLPSRIPVSSAWVRKSNHH